jgi:hypothetical protein
MQFCAHIQPGVAHFFEQVLMQALTSQLTARAGEANASVRLRKIVAVESAIKPRGITSSNQNAETKKLFSIFLGKQTRNPLPNAFPAG